MLILAALLFARSLSNLRHIDTGFRRAGVLVAGIDLRRLDVPPERRHDLQRELLGHIRSIPGVRAAASASVIPVSGSTSGNNLWLEGTTAQVNTSINRVSPGYFATLGIPILSGRDFDERDTMSAPGVAIVNETFAQRVTGGADPVGRRFRIEATPSTPELTYEVVGMARNSIYADLREEPYPLVFLALAQSPRPWAGMRVVIHSALTPGVVASGVTSALRQADPRIAVAFRVLDTQIDDTVVRERLLAMLSSFFAGIAALLALLGLYGVIAYDVTRRTNEIGIRMALGAGRGAVLSMVLREAALLIAAGVVVGVLIALGTGRLAQSLLFGIEPHEPWTLVSATAVLIVLGFLASYWPARAATRIDPTIALRTE